MESLPAAALEVIGQYLEPQDLLGCRLGARCLAPITAKPLPTSYITVVAKSFQLQLQHESSTSSSTLVATTAATTTTADPPTQDVRPLLIASEEQISPAGKAATAAASAVAEGGDEVTCSPTFRSGTAASLNRAAAAGYSKAFVYVDVLQEYRDQTWQELFGALLSSNSSISALTIVEYSSISSNNNSRGAMAKRRDHADLDPEVRLAASLGASAAATAAVGPAGSSDWLPALVSAYTSVSPEMGPSLRHLELELPVPLPVHLQPLLLHLTGLKALALYPSTAWPRMPGDPGPIEPVLEPHVIQGLTQLSSLESLTCCVAATTDSLEDSQAAVMLQPTFSDLGRHITHLSFGLSCSKPRGYHDSDYPVPRPALKPQVQLSAPLVSMSNLRSLVCKPKSSLDTDDAITSLDKESATAATSGIPAATDSSSSSSSLRLQIGPALNKLVLNNGLIHGRLLRLLAGDGISTAVDVRSRSQLVYLELDCEWWSAVSSIGELSQLAGLRYLKAVVEHGDELTSLCRSSLTSQLQGLTLTCTCDRLYYDNRYRPLQLVTSFTALQSLAILAEHDVIMHPVGDLERLCGLTHLRHLTIQKLYGEYESIKLGADTIRSGTLPCGLQSLAIKLYPDQYNEDEPPHLKFAIGEFPTGLTALEFTGCFGELVEDNDDPACHQLEVATAMPCDSVGLETSVPRTCTTVGPANEATPVNPTHNMIRGNTRNSGIAITFPSLTQLSADFSTTDSAQEFLRCCRSLRALDLRIPVPADIEDSPSEANTVSLQLSEWCPLLNNLRLTLTGRGKLRMAFAEFGLADSLFEMIWPSVPSLTGLQELAVTVYGTLSHDTIVPCLSGLSCLTRLRDLTLEFKLDVGCLSAQYASKHQQEHEQEGHNAAAGSSEGDEHPTSRSSHVENAERGQPVTIDRLGVGDPLSKALRGCPGLRRLVLDAPSVIVENGWPIHRESCQAGKNVTLDCKLDEKSCLVQIGGELRNCLVLGQHVYDS